jgi:hypothetical protein
VNQEFDPAQILSGDLSEWISVLPTYQQKLLKPMLEEAEPDQVAQLWLAASGPQDTAPFGGIRKGAVRYYENVLAELKKLFCGSEEYENERRKLAQAAGGGQMLVVGTVSTAIAPHVGTAAAVIGPAVALILVVLSRAARSSACETLDLMIEECENRRRG